jgi:hypothetical protein
MVIGHIVLAQGRSDCGGRLGRTARMYSALFMIAFVFAAPAGREISFAGCKIDPPNPDV